MNVASLDLPLSNAALTHRLGFCLGEQLPAGTVLLLTGDLGTGKTTLVQGLGQGLGIQQSIDSPTFTLINEYLEGRLPLYHFDLYRLEPGEVGSLHPEIYWDGDEMPPGIVAIEWAERLPYQPDHYLEIQLWHQPDGSRLARLQGIGELTWSPANLVW